MPTPSSERRWPEVVDVRVHQAEGMIAAQTGLPIAESCSRFEHYCCTHRRSRRELAIEVVDRRARFWLSASGSLRCSTTT